MARALILNAGSSTLKWAVLEAGGATIDSGNEDWSAGGAEQIRKRLAGIRDVDAVGHRVVHGGSAFREAVILDAAARATLTEVVALDELHMKPALVGIDAASAAFPDKPQIAAFDTAFHSTISDAAAGYALPHEWTSRFGLRRFGFHGLSVAWSVSRVAALSGGQAPARVVVCHLGSGSSITAVRGGRSIDTSMGMTPLEGLVMATRAGSIDPGLILHLLQARGIGVDELHETLLHRSGLLGVSGVSSDLRKVIAAADRGDARARLAWGEMILSIVRTAGAAIAVLGGLDALVFTGGIGENSDRVRGEVAAALAFAGIAIDGSIDTRRDDVEITRRGAAARTYVIHAREDLVILADVARLLSW